MSEKKKGRPKTKSDAPKKPTKKTEKKEKHPTTENPKKRKKSDSTTTKSTASKASEKKEPEVKVVREAKSRFIIIQPGSQNLRIGLSSSTEPFVVPHCIAHRKRDSASADQMVGTTVEVREGLDFYLKNIEREFPTQNASKIVYDASNSSVELAANPSNPYNIGKIYPGLKDENILIGEDAVRLLPDDPYFLYYPFRFGYINKSEHQSIHAFEGDIEILWKTVIANKLKIRPEDFENFPVLLIIPDMFQKSDLAILSKILFDRLNFPSVFIQRESVCASASVGKLVSCIVDIGHTKTSVACVDNGEVILGTSFHMNFGGSNITTILADLLKKQQIQYSNDGETVLEKNFGGHYYPFTRCNLNFVRDFLIMQNIKETCCHLNKKISHQTKSFTVYSNRTGQGTKYSLNLSSVALLAPYSLFEPEDTMAVRHFITDYESNVSGGKPKRLSKRKFEPILDVQWDQIDFDDDDLNQPNMHFPFTEASTLHSDVFGVEFMNRSNNAWVPSLRQRQKDTKSKSKPKERKVQSTLESLPGVSAAAKEDNKEAGKTEAEPIVIESIAKESSSTTNNTNSAANKKEGEASEAMDVETKPGTTEATEPGTEGTTTDTEKAKELNKNIRLRLPNYCIDKRKEIPLDHCIIESIQQVDSKELRCTMYENIILIGGSSAFVGLKEMLKERLLGIKPREHPHVDVYNSNEFFREPVMVSWQGMQVIGSFLQPKDFIDKEDWKKKSVGALREKLHFLFDNNDNKKID